MLHSDNHHAAKNPHPHCKKTARFTAHDSCPAGVGNEEEMVPSVGPVFISGRDRGLRCSVDAARRSRSMRAKQHSACEVILTLHPA